MPKRKLQKPSIDTVEAIEAAMQQGIPLALEGLAQARGSAFLLPYPSLPKNVESDIGYDGQRRYWADGQRKGPGSLELPLCSKVQKMERDYLTELAKFHRLPPVEAASQARTASSKLGAIELALLELGLNNRNAPALIASRLKVTAGYVRKIRNQMRLTERTP